LPILTLQGVNIRVFQQSAKNETKMKLHLKAIRTGGFPDPQPEITILEESGGTIGRDPGKGVDWVLADPTVSGEHARIDYRDGAYYLTDISTNGVFVNDSAQRMNFGDEHRISNGDSFKIGNYVLVANLVSGEEPEAEDFGRDQPENHVVERDREAANSSVRLTDPYVKRPSNWSQIFKSTDTGIDNSAEEQNVGNGFGIGGIHMPPPPPHIPSGTDEREQAPSQYVPGEYSETSKDQDESEPDEPQEEQGSEAQGFSRSGVSQDRESSSSAAKDDLQALLEALGVSELDLLHMDSAEIMRCIGLMLREALDGIINVLRARERFKYELYIRGSIINDNPLKFSVNTSETIASLLRHHAKKDHLPPEKAVRQAIRDIAAHQQALMEGTIASLQGAGTISRLDPEKLKHEWSDEISGIEHMFDQARKAKLWALFIKQYPKLAQEAENEFRKEFDQKLARTYADTIERLRRH
jgi:type VI secretion system protein